MTTKHIVSNKFCCESLIAKLMAWILEAFILKCKLKMLSFPFVLKGRVVLKHGASLRQLGLLRLGIAVVLSQTPQQGRLRCCSLH